MIDSGFPFYHKDHGIAYKDSTGGVHKLGN